MGRVGRQKGIFDRVMELPWPFGVVAAVLTFVLFQWLLSEPPQSPVEAALFPVVRVVGWLLTVGFLLVGLLACVRQKVDGRRYSATRTPADEEPFIYLTPVEMEEADPRCPVCRVPMVKNVAQIDADRSRTFWGCPNCPNCRGAREIA